MAEYINNTNPVNNENHNNNINNGTINNDKDNGNNQEEDVLESEKENILGDSHKDLVHLRKELEKTIQKLELALKQSVMLSGNSGGSIGDNEQVKLRQDQEDVLLKAKTLLFDRMKVIKSQEQQIESLKQQVEALKDVTQATKDMLNLKTAECEHTQARLDKAHLWIKAEQSKCEITERKLAISKNVCDKLKAEYDIQSKIFKELRETYEMKIKVLTDTIKTLKE